jgi:hypothetical protein
MNGWTRAKLLRFGWLDAAAMREKEGDRQAVEASTDDDDGCSTFHRILRIDTYFD